MNEHEYEPVPALPEALPPGEVVIWQGSPRWQQMAVHVFHTQKVAAYFILLAVGLAGLRLYTGQPVGESMAAATGQIILGTVVLLILVTLAIAYSRTTIYTLTNRRLVLRFGVAIPMMINLPIDKLNGVSVNMRSGDSGDVLLDPVDEVEISWWALWPNTRPWRFDRAQPLLRCLPDAQTPAKEIAALLSISEQRSSGGVAAPHTTSRRDRSIHQNNQGPTGNLATA